MKRKIYIKLIGGLGNQLFQYSCAKNLSIELNGDLIIDDKSGFFFDRKFKRKKSLPESIKFYKIKLFELIYFNFLIILKKLIFKKEIFFNIGKTVLIDETLSNEFIFDIKNKIKKYDKIFLLGFFQSENYFLENRNIIIEEILNNNIENPGLIKIKKQITKETLLICIRMFQEAPMRIRNNFGGIEDFSFYNNSIKLFEEFNNLKIQVLTTFEDILKIRKNINKDIEIIDEEQQTQGTDMEFILLMSYFKNFIISNSTFYWWGAYLAEYRGKIKIISSNKFTNKSTVPSRWKKLNN